MVPCLSAGMYLLFILFFQSTLAALDRWGQDPRADYTAVKVIGQLLRVYMARV